MIRKELVIEVYPRTIQRALKQIPDEHATTPECPILSPAIVVRYEVLRITALGEALPAYGPQWPHSFCVGRMRPVQALAVASPVQQPFHTSSLAPPVPRNERTAGVHVLATMAMSTPDWRTP